MIIDLPDTTTPRRHAASSSSCATRAARSPSAGCSRSSSSRDEAHAEDAIAAANDASREHPCRVIVVVARQPARHVDAARRRRSASAATPAPARCIVLRLYGQLRPTTATASSSRCCCPTRRSSPGGPARRRRRPAEDPIGRMAQRRITDAAATPKPDRRTLEQLRATSTSPGDTDLAWTRITLWRGLLAAALDQPPYDPVTAGDRHRWQSTAPARSCWRRGSRSRCAARVTRPARRPAPADQRRRSSASRGQSSSSGRTATSPR